jgi:flagellar hook-associated protein 2
MSKSLQAQLASNQKDQTRYEARVATIEKRLRADYTSLDTTVAKFNSLNSYVSQQVSAMSKWNNNGN